jgi:hypothetical protein
MIDWSTKNTYLRNMMIVDTWLGGDVLGQLSSPVLEFVFAI